MSKAHISESEQKKLHTKSGNVCAICKEVLVSPQRDGAACIGENAHIYGENPGSARYDSSKDDTFVNSEANLIFLCCNCHKRIDTEVSDFPADKLMRIKANHEAEVVRKLTQASMTYSCADLETLVKFLILPTTSRNSSISYSVLKIDSKIRKNDLDEIKDYITIGLTNNKTIDDYLNKHPDSSYSDRLNCAMSEKYRELKSQGISSVDIFYELWDFASGYSDEYNMKAAGLGIVAFFFEKCEVFEK